MANLIYDGALSFGTRSISAGEFPNILNLGRTEHDASHYPGKDFTSADRLTVDVVCSVAEGTAGMTVIVQGSADGSTGWTDVGKNTFTADEMRQGPCQTAISPSKFQYLRASLLVTGTFSGDAEAFLNTYQGR